MLMSTGEKLVGITVRHRGPFIFYEGGGAGRIWGGGSPKKNRP